jgi:hypothetical protein
MECLGLHNKPKAAVQPGHLLTGPKEEEEEEEEERMCECACARVYVIWWFAVNIERTVLHWVITLCTPQKYVILLLRHTVA